MKQTRLAAKAVKRIQRKLAGYIKFQKDRRKYSQLNQRPEFAIMQKNMYPVLTSYYEQAGSMGQYFYQDLWAAQKIYKHNPQNHYDIGSRVDGFIMALLSFREVVLIDVRPLPDKIEGLHFMQADAKNLKNIKSNSLESLSALCSLEHFGLGRYGDEVDPDAFFKACQSIQRVMKKGGRVYICVPVASEDRVAFNAHRIFSPQTVIKEFDKMALREFTVRTSGAVTIEHALERTEWIHTAQGGKHLDFGFFEFEKL